MRGRHGVRTFSEREIKSLRDARKAGVSPTALAERYGVSVNTICTRLKYDYKNGRRKLTEEQVRQIRRSLRDGGVTQCELAKRYNVSHNCVWNIAEWNTYQEVEI